MAWVVLVEPHGQKNEILSIVGRRNGFLSSREFNLQGYYRSGTMPTLLPRVQPRSQALQTLLETYCIQ